jgi:hypothetical protein
MNPCEGKIPLEGKGRGKSVCLLEGVLLVTCCSNTVDVSDEV